MCTVCTVFTGRGGQKIRELEEKSGARIKVYVQIHALLYCFFLSLFPFLNSTVSVLILFPFTMYYAFNDACTFACTVHGQMYVYTCTCTCFQ